jgi:hypothetical protein
MVVTLLVIPMVVVVIKYQILKKMKISLSLKVDS